MSRLIAIVLTLLLAACSTAGINTNNPSRSLDPVNDDVASLLIAFDLPRGLGPNNVAGQLFTFDVAQGGPAEKRGPTRGPAGGRGAGGELGAGARGPVPVSSAPGQYTGLCRASAPGRA